MERFFRRLFWDLVGCLLISRITLHSVLLLLLLWLLLWLWLWWLWWLLLWWWLSFLHVPDDHRFANVAFNAIRPIVISQDNSDTGEKDEVKPPEIYRIEKVRVAFC
jgi:hypothetical protein